MGNHKVLPADVPVLVFEVIVFLRFLWPRAIVLLAFLSMIGSFDWIIAQMFYIVKFVAIWVVYRSLRNWLPKQWDSVGTLDRSLCEVTLYGRQGRGPRRGEANGEPLFYIS